MRTCCTAQRTQHNALWWPKWKGNPKRRRSWIHMGFPGGSVVKNPPASARDAEDMGLIPGSGRPPRGGNVNPFQYSCLENSMDRGAWHAAVRWGGKEQTRLSMHTQKVYIIWCVCVLVNQSSLTFCDPMDYSLPGSSIHGILQARILEWVDISFSRDIIW